MSTHDCKFNPKPFRTCKEGKERQEEKQPLVLVLLELSSLRGSLTPSTMRGHSKKTPLQQTPISVTKTPVI